MVWYIHTMVWYHTYLTPTKFNHEPRSFYLGQEEFRTTIHIGTKAEHNNERWFRQESV